MNLEARLPLVIGYGNLLRGDDAVGPYVATKLGGVVAQQLLPEMAKQLSLERLVIFVDARTDLAPGVVKILPVEEENLMTHRCSPGSLLKLAREVYGRAPEATLVGIGAESFDLGANMSLAARRGARDAITEIRRLRVSARTARQAS